ncbi:MAG: membrane dipeptidase, partial [Chitinophagaceae bacterium]|nr:membrane dipeptidase [Chitinophagaceae bacterium]
MKPLLLILFLLMLAGQPSAQLYQQVHRKATLVDTHNDVLSSAVLEGKDISKRLTTGHSDFERWKEGGVNVQFFSVWTDKNSRNKAGFYADANQEIDSLERIVLRNHQRLALALRYKDIRRGIRQNKLVAMIGVEGGHMIEDDIGKLDA